VLALASFSLGWLLIIRLIIQTILPYPSGAVWTDEPSNVSRPDIKQDEQDSADSAVAT
jgi:hypothetical protein